MQRRDFSRNQRLGGQILRLLNELLLQESKDPRLKFVSISNVELSRDLSVARVFFSAMNPNDDIEPIAEGLASAAGFLRSRIGKSLKIRHTPELRFHHDDSIERAIALSTLIDSAEKGSDETES